MNNRIDLAFFFNEKGYKVGAEIGVAEGRFSEILYQSIPGLQLFCIDPWTPYEGSWRGKDYQKGAYQQAVERLSKYNAKLIKKNSLEASFDIQDNSLDFVFIDGCHRFNYVMLDIILWNQKVRKGGIVSGHDYCHFKDSGVVEAVNAYTQTNKIELNIISRNNESFKDDRQPCWWFMKK